MIKSVIFLSRVAIEIALAFALGALVCGQGPATPQPRNARPDPVQREIQRQYEMEMIERALTERRAQPVKRFAPLVLDQIRSDFLRLQMVDRQLMKAMTMATAIDFDLVTESAAEIRRHSRRLKKNLALPELETAPADRSALVVEAKPASLRTSLSSLSHWIEEFVSNPMFEQVRLVDPQLASKARRDIEAIIELSSQIKSASEKLKTAAKSH